MEYQVLARKWRPQRFADVIGQEHVTKTLQNQIIRQRTAHAYLFVGPRGIGKTTIARIFAKALICKEYPAPEPCCKCNNCLAVQDGSCLDVIEIDGASNNTVENVRNLRDEVYFSPVSGKFKIYIVDEVHMLSTGAWNAFLKTVEEPPAHVKFIFATTEAHKVIPTIVSRCQRFDLRRIPTATIAKTLAKIAEKENVKITQEALNAIARAADGGMRDAESLLDQMISFRASENDEISEADIVAVFGLASNFEIKNIISALLNNTPQEIVNSINSIAKSGKNLEKLYDDILSSLRAIQITKISGTNASQILEEDDDSIKDYLKIAEQHPLDKIQRLIDTLSTYSRGLRDAINKQIFMEAMLLKAARIAHSAKVEDLINKIIELESNNIEHQEEKKKSPEYRHPPLNTSLTQNQTKSEEKKVSEHILHKIHEKQTQYLSYSTTINNKNEKTLPKNEQLEKKLPSAEHILNELIKEAEIAIPHVKDKLQELLPKSFDGKTLELILEAEYTNSDFRILEADKLALENCLKRILPEFKNPKINIIREKEILSPKETITYHSNDIKKLKKEAEKNEFIKNIMEKFNGKIVDVWGIEK